MIFLNKLEELFKFYLETRKFDTFDALVDEVVKLQFLESLDPTLRSFVESVRQQLPKWQPKRRT